MNLVSAKAAGVPASGELTAHCFAKSFYFIFLWVHIIFYFHTTSQGHGDSITYHLIPIPSPRVTGMLNSEQWIYWLFIFHTRLIVYACICTHLHLFYFILSLSVIFFTSFGLYVVQFYSFPLPIVSHNLKGDTSFYSEKISAKAKLMMTLLVNLLEVFCSYMYTVWEILCNSLWHSNCSNSGTFELGPLSCLVVTWFIPLTSHFWISKSCI